MLSITCVIYLHHLQLWLKVKHYSSYRYCLQPDLLSAVSSRGF